MGCEPSMENNRSQIQLSQTNTDQFKLSYRQFVRNDVGQVFQFYHFSKMINRSSTSLVRKVIHRVSKIQRVCKIIPIQKKHFISAVREVQNLKTLDHPNVVQIQQYFLDKRYLYIIMEYIDGLRLSQFLLSHGNLSLDALIKIFQQLLSTINYCHKKGIVHNLIHPQNIVIMEKGKQYFLKLIDFSQAAVAGSPRISKINFIKDYQLFRDVQIHKNINQKNDVWSCGITFLFMLCGQKNFTNFFQNKMKIVRDKISCFDIEEQTVTKLVDLFQKMLNQNIDKRISIEECLKHPIFQQFIQSRLMFKHRKKQDQFLSRLIHFKVKDQLQSVFWMYASLNLLSSTQKCQYITQFSNLDKNKDGKLDKQQIKEGLINTFGLKQSQAEAYVEQIFSSIDKNNNKYLQYSQFVMATSLVSNRISLDQLQKIFRQIDYNHDGYISIDELSTLTGGLQGASFILKQRKKISQKQFKKLMLQIFEKSKIGTKQITQNTQLVLPE